jgi:hypothetical protein
MDRIICMFHRPHNHTYLVPFTKLQHYAIESLKVQISYALVSGILYSSVDLSKAKCQLRSVDSGSSLLLCSYNTGCRNYCHTVAKTAQRWLCKALGSESLLWLLHLLSVFLFLECGVYKTLMWMFKLSCHATHLLLFWPWQFFGALSVSKPVILWWQTWYVICAEHNTVEWYVHDLTIKSWNHLPAGLLASFPYKLNTFRKRVKNVVTSKRIQVGVWV